MTGKAFAVFLALILSAGALGSADSPAPLERTALGADIGTTAAGAFMGAVAGSFSLELPLSRAWAIDIEPSFYGTSGTGTSILQINVEVLTRFYLLSLFLDDLTRPVQWGPFAAAGGVAAWGYSQGDSTITVLALGPAVRAGYRFVFGNAGIFAEPSVGFMALFGGQFAPAGVSSSVNTGITLGLIVGWRF